MNQCKKSPAWCAVLNSAGRRPTTGELTLAIERVYQRESKKLGDDVGAARAATAAAMQEKAAMKRALLAQRAKTEWVIRKSKQLELSRRIAEKRAAARRRLMHALFRTIPTGLLSWTVTYVVFRAVLPGATSRFDVLELVLMLMPTALGITAYLYRHTFPRYRDRLAAIPSEAAREVDDELMMTVSQAARTRINCR